MKCFKDTIHNFCERMRMLIPKYTKQAAICTASDVNNPYLCSVSAMMELSRSRFLQLPTNGNLCSMDYLSSMRLRLHESGLFCALFQARMKVKYRKVLCSLKTQFLQNRRLKLCSCMVIFCFVGIAFFGSITLFYI